MLPTRPRRYHGEFQGILTRLDDKCKQTRKLWKDTDFVDELHRAFSQRSYARRADYEKAVVKLAGKGKSAKAITAEYLRCGAFYEGPKPSERPGDWFTIRHFAGKVTYKIKGFIEKNKDKVPNHLRSMCKFSVNEVLRRVYTEVGSGAAVSATKKQKAADTTIASKFLGQLKELVKTTNATKRHYVRCVKPNDKKLKFHQDGAFHARKTLRQLKFAGILQAVQIRQEGYPFRETFAHFWSRAVELGWTKLAGVRDEQIRSVSLSLSLSRSLSFSLSILVNRFQQEKDDQTFLSVKSTVRTS